MTKSEFISQFYSNNYNKMLDNLYRKYYPSFDKSQIEDFIQDGLVSFVDKVKPKEDSNKIGHYMSYLYKSVNSKIINYFRKAKVDEVELIENYKYIPQQSERVKVDRHIKQILRKTLTPRQYACFILYELYSFKYDEIASSLNITTGAVKSNLHYARKSACNLLKPEDYEIYC